VQTSAVPHPPTILRLLGLFSPEKKKKLKRGCNYSPLSSTQN